MSCTGNWTRDNHTRFCPSFTRPSWTVVSTIAKLRELLLDYDKMLASAADEIAYQSRGLRMDSVLNALRIRMYDLRVEVD